VLFRPKIYFLKVSCFISNAIMKLSQLFLLRYNWIYVSF